MGEAAPPPLPLARLRASRSDLLRTLCERQPAWLHCTPTLAPTQGDRAVANYRLQPESFFLQVHWRRQRDEWEERDVVVVPGAVVTLRFVLDQFDPAAVTRALGLAPTRAFGKGESGAHGRGVRDEGLWIHEVMPRGFHFAEEKLAELLALLRARPGFRDVVGAAGVRWAGVSLRLRGCVERLGGLCLEPHLIADLAGLSLALDLELGAD